MYFLGAKKPRSPQGSMGQHGKGSDNTALPNAVVQALIPS